MTKYLLHAQTAGLFSRGGGGWGRLQWEIIGSQFSSYGGDNGCTGWGNIQQIINVLQTEQHAFALLAYAT